MEILALMSPKNENERDTEEFIEENSCITGSAGLSGFVDNYNGWLEKFQDDFNIYENRPDKDLATTLLVIRKDDEKIIGSISLRHKLDDTLIIKGGHIGYSVRPSERRKGYATEILSLELLKLEEMGIKNVLITCYKNNIGSAKTIQKNCGVLDGVRPMEENYGN